MNKADWESLSACRAKIAREARLVGVAEHSHHIIRLTLSQIAEKFGRAEANQTIRDLKLTRLGWREEPE